MWARKLGLFLTCVVIGLVLVVRPAPAEGTPGDQLFRANFTTADVRLQPQPGRGCVRYHDGYLVLCLRQNAEGRLVEGRVDTKDRWSFTYARVSARIKFLGPRGAHGSGWITTTEDYIPGQAEIDYAEYFGRARIHHAVHWRLAHMRAETFLSDKHATEVDDPGEWHVYSVNWMPHRYAFFIDGKRVATSTEGLSDRPKMLVFSLLSSDYERKHLRWGKLSRYTTVVDWVEVESNRWTA